MLPTGTDYAGSLTDVVPSLLASIGVDNFTNSLDFPHATSTVLVLVDGLGEENMVSARGHARFLLSSNHERRVISTVFPSTTAAALVSLMTGEFPGQHGIAGYRILEPESGHVINQLTELGSAPTNWMSSTLLAERLEGRADVFVVGRTKFADSALTKTVYRGATYVASESFAERCATASDLARTSGRLVLVYASELDSAAHKFGVASSKWTDALELVDSGLQDLRRTLPVTVSIVVTADHGVLDVSEGQHIVFERGVLTEGVTHVGGEPRCLQLYLESPGHLDAVVREWRSAHSDVAHVLTRNEVIESGVLGRVAESVIPRLGDVFVMAHGNVVFYDGRELNTSPQRMVGQHGSLSSTEMRIPLVELRHSA